MARDRLQALPFVVPAPRDDVLERIGSEEARWPGLDVRACLDAAVPAAPDVDVPERADVEVQLVLHLHLVATERRARANGLTDEEAVIEPCLEVSPGLGLQVRVGRPDLEWIERDWD